MKARILLLTLFGALATYTNAFSLKNARNEALFLTDKMAYELDLTDDQYNAVYEINLDYYINIDISNDILGEYWSKRNTELEYVLTAAQFRLYTGANYFYRPITFMGRKFIFTIYNRYDRNRYFRSAPTIYNTYKGGNRRYVDSPYKGRSFTGKIISQPKPSEPNLSRREAIREGRDADRNFMQNNRRGTFTGHSGENPKGNGPKNNSFMKR